MKRILYWLGLVDLVWTQDHSGSIRLRVVWYKQNGDRFVYAILGPSFRDAKLSRLLPSGTTDGTVIYLAKWYPYNNPPPLVTFLRDTVTWRRPKGAIIGK